MKIKTLGDRVRELREAKDLSLRELARAVETSAAHMSDIEWGRRFPSRNVLEKMAKVLDVSPEELDAYDSRAPVDEMKKLAQQDAAYGFAFRKMVGIPAEELLKLVKQFEEKKGKE